MEVDAVVVTVVLAVVVDVDAVEVVDVDAVDSLLHEGTSSSHLQPIMEKMFNNFKSSWISYQVVSHQT